MGYSIEVKRKARDILSERRLIAQKSADIRREQIFSELPEVEELERRIASCGINAARAIVKGGDVKKRLEELKALSLRLQNEQEQLLLSKGYYRSDLQPKYHCPICSDKGFYEHNNRSIMCECMKKVMIDVACEELNRTSPLKLSTFDDFSLKYYPMDIEEGFPRSSYDQMSRILSYCKEYAKNFSENSESIFMKGLTGLGKTHLSLAIANEVIRKGFGVIYISSPRLCSVLEKEHFAKNKPETSTEELLLECDLLIVDDLGTEFSTAFSNSALYNLFNSRLLSGKPVIVNTNLELKQLRDLYTDRFVSRIIGQAKRLDFFGRDVRILKK